MTTATRSEPTQTNERGDEMMAAFCASLSKSKDGLAYMAERNLPLSLIEDGALGLVPPYANHWFPLLRGRLVTPIRDSHGRIRAFAGRILPFMRNTVARVYREYNAPERAQELIDRWDGAKWINEPYPKRKLLYNLDRAKPYIQDRGYVCLVEGYFDALILSARHMENTSALCGTSLTEHHAALLSRYCDQVVSIYDGDQAGREAIERARETALASGLVFRAVILPTGYDPDEFAVERGGRNLRKAIEGMIERDEHELEIKI
ncbi:MAG: toprim domain-containing protein [Armatimonadetes bacterium]|nr:toprim domain-containing protein [Armatimonadota bacterium]